MNKIAKPIENIREFCLMQAINYAEERWGGIASEKKIIAIAKQFEAYISEPAQTMTITNWDKNPYTET